MVQVPEFGEIAITMPTRAVIRGDLSLADDDFQAHIAQAVRLENVGLLLGAGASVGADGLTMKQLWQSFADRFADSLTYLRDNNFVEDSGSVPNIETVIDRVEVGLLDGQRKGVDVKEIQELRGHATNLMRSIVSASVLDEELIKEPSKSVDSPKLADHRRLLSRLVSNRQPGQAAPWLFTINYDLAVEWACEAIDLHVVNGFGGTHARRFSPANFELGFRNVSATGEARFGVYNIYLAKLHGSLAWRISPDRSVKEIQIDSVCEALEKFRDGTSDEAPGVLIYPGSAKFVESTGFVYGEMIRRMTEFLSRSNTCLIVNGYGFNDFHINRILVSALQNPTLQLIVYLPEIERFDVDKDSGQVSIVGDEVSGTIKSLVEKKFPQLTVCGGGADAYFKQLSLDLPQPALVDDQAKRSKEIMKLLVASRADRTDKT